MVCHLLPFAKVGLYRDTVSPNQISKYDKYD